MTVPTMAAINASMMTVASSSKNNTGSVAFDNPAEGILVVVALVCFILLGVCISSLVIELILDHPIITMICLIAIILLCGGLLCVV